MTDEYGWHEGRDVPTIIPDDQPLFCTMRVEEDDGQIVHITGLAEADTVRNHEEFIAWMEIEFPDPFDY